jgi:DNA-binding transcriptional LysR family regulator
VSAQLKIRDLELVMALHEEGNVTVAARRIGISEPALSKRLRAIEHQVQVQLFDRSHEGATITEAGRAFVEHAQQSLQEFHRAVHEARETKRGTSHKLSIGASSFLSPHLIELLRSVELRLFRDLTIEIVSEYSCELLSQLQRHRIDLALVTSPPSNAAITTVRIATNPFMLVLRENHPLADKGSARLVEVAEYPWALFSRNVHPPLYDLIHRRLEAEHKRARIAHRISHAEQVPALLHDDSLVAWMTPNGAERIARNGLVRIPLLDSEINLEMHLASLANNKSRLVSEYVRSFVKRIEEPRLPVQLSLPINEVTYHSTRATHLRVLPPRISA